MILFYINVVLTIFRPSNDRVVKNKAVFWINLKNKMLNQVHPVKKIHPYNHFSDFFFVFLQIYCANMGVEHGLSPQITGAS